MKAVVVGLATQGTVLPVEGFPVPYTAVRSVPHQITTCVGGAGFAVSRTLAALGDDVSLAAPLGEDAAAAAIDAVAFRFGVSTALCVRTLARTPREVILTEPSGRRHVSSDLGDVPSAHLDPAMLAEPLRTTDVVLLDDIALSRPVVAVAKGAGVPVMADLHDVPGPLDLVGDEMLGVDVLVMSNRHVRGREEDVLLAIREQSAARLLVMTRAEDGLLALTPELARPINVEAYSTGPVAHPDGAGDTFFAALAHFLVGEKHAPVAALRRAAVAAGWVLAHPEESDWLSVEVVEAIVGAGEEVAVEPTRTEHGAA
ncbi:carbohydrate kinase family protein [Georgenia sp. MJ206]|uniref:carbohydrate kinase family protein n=1 Tax=Georgenia wangjunii TaxID=3117730 RepID=UPI002F26D306